jgi:hypothetical protein
MSPGRDLALQQRAPEPGQRVRIACVKGDLVDLQRSPILAVCHKAHETMPIAALRKRNRPVPAADHEAGQLARASRCRGWAPGRPDTGSVNYSALPYGQRPTRRIAD